ncbi:MAG: hypothetical protein A3J46_04240 [Candidatus Yanofskybacteria bacterium RIFCSPHIGHO2_02_FULL_41_11]|uniref:Uncharacterized protein n=1 Tax=Candidatus Yanofskybacteria bacterium RIFCSPHIGHO2_02_FULL_41_11 TaxID=1802675 RepID=A0A1F8FA34_9BACT|nr:MAG: hypothetical protein A3J46_04240 [Candidatus Yanofskybacteria bacterium RIFCSPHIGHO2_02_FULL_41_11]
MGNHEIFDEQVEKMFKISRETVERDQFVKTMLETLPPDMVPGFIGDEIEAIDQAIDTVDKALARFRQLKEDVSVENFTTWKNKLLEQRRFLLDTQSGLSK